MSRSTINDIWQSFGLGHVHINKYAKFYQILLRERIRAVSFLFEFRSRQSLDRPMINALVNGIWQSLGLDLVYINVYAIFVNIVTGRDSSIGSVSAGHASGPEFDIHIRRILSWRLRPFTLFRWFRKSRCQLLAKECALSTGNLPRRLAQEQCGLGNWMRPNWPKMCCRAVKQKSNQKQLSK